MTVYLDHNATAPLDPRVLAEMLPVLQGPPANASARHGPGRRAAELVDRAKEQVCALVGASTGMHGYDVVFTAGATEAANLALRGLPTGTGRNRFVVGATEHRAVLEPARAAAAATRGQVVLAPVDRDGVLDLDQTRALVGTGTAVVAVMAANNETGALAPVHRVAAWARAVGAVALCDVTQAVGRIRVDLEAWGVDLAVLSAHKIGGPQGVGALVGRRDVLRTLGPLVLGGGQQRGLRAGTLDTAGVVGFGAAAALALREQAGEARRQQYLTRALWQQLEQRLDRVHLNGPVRQRLPNTLNVRFVGAPADAVLTCLTDVAASAGSACHAGDDEPSHVLLAMGRTRVEALQSVRFSLGRTTTADDVRTAADAVVQAVEHVRGLREALSRWR